MIMSIHHLKYRFELPFVLFGLCVILLTSSCRTQNMFESNLDAKDTLHTVFQADDYRPLISPDDKLSLSIWNHDNLSVGSVFGIYNSNEVYGKWIMVNPEGFVSLPKIGPVKLGGLTTDEAAELLKEQYAKYILNPIIVVKVLNREISVLGEVLNPGSYPMDKEKNYVVEYLAKAGGLNFYAAKSKVILIREGQHCVLDFTDMEAYNRSNMLLKNGDVIYVPTKKGKSLDKKAPTLIPFTSLATTIALLISILGP